MESYIKISDITYKYDSMLALNNVNLDIYKNELFGVIGPDGAGKTTLFRILATLLLIQKGSVKFDNIDIVKNYKSIRKIIGYMPGKFSLYQDLTVLENLEFFASIFDTTIQENYHLIKDIYSLLEPFKNRKAGKLSGGMKQKLALSCALIHKPEILILDEPTTGVDAVSRREFWDMLSILKNMGITIIVSTPYMDEAKRCDRVALIKDGEILKTDITDNIEKQFRYSLYAMKCDNNFKLLNYLREISETENCYSFGQSIHAVVKDDNHIKNIDSILHSAGFDDVMIQKVDPNIEDCFIQFMQEKEGAYDY